MRLVRCNNRFGGWLALAALALQIVVSFGHVHPGSVHSHSAIVTAAALGGQGSQSCPAHNPSDDADDYCAICATIYLAANSFVPMAPQLAVPSASQTIEHVDRVAVAFIASRRAPFQSRAPPLA
jgi:Protein of unknown function (DUF2946)